MEALYKCKGKFGVAGREKRKECSKLNSKAKRDSLIASKRKMSIDLNVSKEAKSPFSVKGKAKEKKDDRLQRLREWQQARDEAKAKSKAQNKRPVFAVRGTGKTQAVSSFTAKVDGNASVQFKSSFSAKKTILCASPKPARPAPVLRASKPTIQQAPKAAPLTTTKKSQESAKPKQSTANPAKKKADPKPAVPTRHSVRLAMKQTVSSATKQVKEPTVHSTKPSNTGKRSTSTSKPLVKKTTRADNTSNKNVPPKGVRTNKKKTLQKESAIPRDKEVVSSGNSDQENEIPIPTTPKKSYKPVHPSPLLHCRSASKERREVIYDPESMYVNDPAWIPGASAPQVAQKPNFEEAFNTDFSPFHFTAGSNSDKNTQFEFTFRMTTDPVPNPNQEAPEVSDSFHHSSISESSMNLSQVNANVSTSLLENLITFSDTSDCSSPSKEIQSAQRSTRLTRSASKRHISCADSETENLSLGSTSKSPRIDSVRKNARKSRSNSKSRKPSHSDENEGVDMDSSKSCKPSSPLSELVSNSPRKEDCIMDEPLHKSSRSCRSSSKQRKSSGVSAVYRMGGEVVRNLELDYDKENDVYQTEELLDVAYFRELHADTCTKLEQLCEVWEGKAAELEQDQDATDLNKEEVLGQIRTICCQSRLLMRQKLRQYIGLVDMAESNSGEKKTTREDLQGFWDMVYFQVDGLYTRFSELADMENAGWQLSFPSPKKSKIQKRKKRGVKQSVPKQPKSAEGSERLEAARKKREAGRAKLRELKTKCSNQQPSDGASDVLIF